MARFSVVDGNESQPARPAPDAGEPSGDAGSRNNPPQDDVTNTSDTPSDATGTPANMPDTSDTPSDATGTPPDVPDTKSGIADEVPAPNVTRFEAEEAGPSQPAQPTSPNGASSDDTTGPAEGPDPKPDTAATTHESPYRDPDPKPDTAATTHESPYRDPDQTTPMGTALPTVVVPAPEVGDATTDQPAADDEAPEPPRPQQLSPRHLRRPKTGEIPQVEVSDQRKYLLLVPAAILALIGLLIVGWAIDNAVHGGQVQRNVQLAGHSVGGATEESLPRTVAQVSEDVAARPVLLQVEEESVELTASDLGLVLDDEAVIDAAMDVGRSEPLWQRPFVWFGSLFSHRDVSPEYRISESQITNTLQSIRAEYIGERVDPAEPGIELTDGRFVLVPGQPGTDVDIQQATDELLAAVEAEEDFEAPLALTVETSEFRPSLSDDDVQGLADEANAMTEGGLALEAGGSERTVSAEQLRGWITPVVDPNEELRLEFEQEAAQAAAPDIFSELTADPQNASVTLSGGQPQITPSESGIRCCGDDAGERIWDALQAGEATVELDAEVVEPEFTTEDVEDWGIVEPVGGSRGWRSGSDVGGPRPGFTTWEVGGGGRAHNIRTIAQEVNGAVVPPGGRFSINDHVGARQCPPYQEGGAILEGEIVSECGGGISQFATTFMNAAYFAGVDIVHYQAHSQYFSRYPRGREATMGAPGSGLDVVIENTTPYGILIQSQSEGDTLTVTFWSTQHIDVAQTGISESPAGDCTRVTTTRTRTFPDGNTRNDQFSALYRPGEGETC